MNQNAPYYAVRNFISYRTPSLAMQGLILAEFVDKPPSPIYYFQFDIFYSLQPSTLNFQP